MLKQARAAIYYLRMINTKPKMFLVLVFYTSPHAVAETTVRYLGLLCIGSTASFYRIALCTFSTDKLRKRLRITACFQSR